MAIPVGSRVLFDQVRRAIVIAGDGDDSTPIPVLSVLPVCIDVKGGFFADQTNPEIKPRLQLEIKFFSDVRYSNLIAEFTTADASFLTYARVLEGDPAVGGMFTVAFPAEGIQAWWEYEPNAFSYPERRAHGYMNSTVLVTVSGLMTAGLLSQTPLTWAARYANVSEYGVSGYSDWDFGTVAAGGSNMSSGSGDSSVVTDATLVGNGTASDPLGVVFGTTPGTVMQGNDPRIANAVQSIVGASPVTVTRSGSTATVGVTVGQTAGTVAAGNDPRFNQQSLTAGTGINISPQGVISAAFGTTAGTVTEGNDPRIGAGDPSGGGATMRQGYISCILSNAGYDYSGRVGYFDDNSIKHEPVAFRTFSALAKALLPFASSTCLLNVYVHGSWTPDPLRGVWTPANFSYMRLMQQDDDHPGTISGPLYISAGSAITVEGLVVHSIIASGATVIMTYPFFELPVTSGTSLIRASASRVFCDGYDFSRSTFNTSAKSIVEATSSYVVIGGTSTTRIGDGLSFSSATVIANGMSSVLFDSIGATPTGTSYTLTQGSTLKFRTSLGTVAGTATAGSVVAGL